MTDKQLNNVAEQCISCIKCDSDFDGVTGLWELVGKRFGIDKSDSWWYLTDTKEDTRIDGSLPFQDVMEQVCNLLNELHEENQQLKDTNTRWCNEYSYFNKQTMKLEKENKELKKELQEFKDYVFSDENILCYSCVNCVSKGIYEVECYHYGKIDVCSTCFAYWKKKEE